MLCFGHVSAGDVATVRAGVTDIDLVDGQDAGHFRGMRQSLAVGLRFHAAVCLVTRKRSENRSSKHGVVCLSIMLPGSTSLPG